MGWKSYFLIFLWFSWISGHDILHQCLTYSPIDTYSILQSQSSLPFCESSPGHWPLETTFSCQNSKISLSFLQETIHIYSHTPDVPSDIVQAWNITSDIDHSPRCDIILQDILLLPIPYDPTGYQSDGSNYYVIHVDILLPLWNYLRGMRAPPTIILFPFNKNLKRELSADILEKVFADPKKYWIHSIQLLTHYRQLLVGTSKGISGAIQRGLSSLNLPFYNFDIKNIMQLCFQNIRFGLPRYDRPSPISLKRYSQFYREAALIPSSSFPSSTFPTLSIIDANISQSLCYSNTMSIGLVIREGRRKIQNEDEFLEIIKNTAHSWCLNNSIYNDSNCEITVKKVYFGKRKQPWGSNVETDIEQLQYLTVLIGLQGSGLINGLYVSPYTSVVVYYLNNGWPISSGDPLEYIAARGPYIRHINTDPTKVLCHIQDDHYCDSGDLLVDEVTYSKTIIEALQQQRSRCHENVPISPP